MNGKFEVFENHLFFDEILHFIEATIVVTLAHRHQVLESVILSVIADAENMAKAFKQNRPYRMERTHDIPSQADPLSIADLDCDHICVIRDIAPLLEYIQGTSLRPNKVRYIIAPRDSSLAVPSGSQIRGQIQTAWITDLTCYLIGGAFERRSSLYDKKFGARQSWPPKLQFFRHLRNACFHGNEFNLRKRGHGSSMSDQIDPANPPQWGPYIMASDLAMNGRVAIDSFFRVPYILPFLDEIGTLI